MTNASDLDRLYETIGQDAQLWLEQAKKLKLSADLMRAPLREALEPAPLTELRRITQLAHLESFMMLTGMAFENLIKGIDIAVDPVLVSGGKLDMSKWKRGGHDLSVWAQNTKLSPDKVNLLVRLEEFVVWAGRYPIPKKSSIYVSSKLPENRQMLSIPTDFNLIDTMFNELSDMLIAAWSANGALKW